MTGPTNEEREEAARAALDAWRDVKGNAEEDESDARDLIADLLHLIRAEHGNPERDVASALMHFHEETSR